MPDHQHLPARAESAIPHVGGYRRVLPVSLERLYENALDWQHLPYVHSDSFTSIRCLDAGVWGWRATTVDRSGRESIIELVLDRACRRWITRTLSGEYAGAEIWTHAFPVADRRVDIVVDFFVPGVECERRARVGTAYAALYERLYDQDVAMMVERQRQLDRRIDRARESERTVLLGPRATLELPMAIDVGGRGFVLVEVAGELVAFPRQCPHQLGPLSADGLHGHVVTCPWHGYRFDVRNGDNLSGVSCRLSHLPEVQVDEQHRVRVTATH